MLSRLLPMRSAPISLSRFSINRLTTPARSSPLVSCVCMRAREAAVSAVSEPEKKAEAAISNRIETSVGQIVCEKVRTESSITPIAFLEEGFDFRHRHIIGDEGLADAMREDEGQLAALDLLVLRDGVQQHVCRWQFAGDLADFRGQQADGAQVSLDTLCIIRACQVQAGRENDAPGPCRSQPPSPCTRRLLSYCVAASSAWPKCVAKVQQRATAVFPLVRHHDIRLGLAAHRNRFGAGSAAGKHILPIGFPAIRRNRPVDQAILGNFRVASAKLTLAQRIQGAVSEITKVRLVEDAEKILAVAGVDAGLAANGGIDLCQKRGRDLHEADAAAHDAGSKSREITDHAATERDDRIIAFDASGQRQIAKRLPDARGSWSFSGRQGQRNGLDAVCCRLSIRLSR